MAHFIDRRLNPKDKSLGNRRRFLRRVRGQVKEAVDRSVRSRGVREVDRSGKVSVPTDGIREPQFHHSTETGRHERVLPGNKEFQTGDRIRKPRRRGGKRGRQGSAEGDGEDEFTFALSREEFLDIFFEDLELPDLVKRNLRDVEADRPRRAGFSATGTPGNLSVERTMRNAVGRRMALRRPTDTEIRDLRARLFELEAVAERSPEQEREIAEITARLEKLLGRQKQVPYLDPLDVRYKHFQPQPEPISSAVMFCLMDVSASMGEREKDLAKRFFVLLHLFLARRYERVDIVFIRHTHQAQEVDENTFFHSRETGGTVVSTALQEMLRVIEARYPPSKWNIYAAQASDGENFSGDSALCGELLADRLMPLCQYFAYVEIIEEEETHFLTSEERGTELWMAYREVAHAWGNFATKRIARPSDIYPVFHDLFAPAAERAHA